MRGYTHGGWAWIACIQWVGTFLTKKNKKNYCAPCGIWTGSRVRRFANSATPSPNFFSNVLPTEPWPHISISTCQVECGLYHTVHCSVWNTCWCWSGWETLASFNSVVYLTGQSEDTGFDPRLVGQGQEQFFCPSESTLMQICLCLTPLHAHTQICAPVKDPISICRKRVGLTAGDLETWKHCTQEKEKKLGSAILWLLAFPMENSLNFPCIALGQESYVLLCNVICL